MTLPQDCPPDVFARLIALMGRGPSMPVRVTGPLDMKGLQVDVPIIFQNVRFSGRVEADSAACKGYVWFVDCVFEAGADFETATIEGNLNFQNCVFGPLATNGGVALRLDHVVIKGGLELSNCTLDGMLSAKHISVDGRIALASSKIGTNQERLHAVALDLSGARTASDLVLNAATAGSVVEDFNPPSDKPTRMAGLIRAHQMTVAGKVVAETTGSHPQLTSAIELNHSSIGGLQLAGFHISGPINLSEVTCNSGVTLVSIKADGGLSLYGARVTNVALDGVEIGGSLEAGLLVCQGIFRMRNGCQIGTGDNRQMLQLSGANVTGQIDLQNCSCGPIVLNGTHCGSFMIGASDAPGTCGAIYAVSSAFASYVRMSGLVVTENSPDTLFSGVYFEGCTFAGDVEFWRPVRNREVPGKGWEWEAIAFTDQCRSARIAHQLRMIRCQIAGDLDLTRVTMTSGAEGAIALDQCTIGGGLRFCSPESFANRRRINPRVRANARAAAEAKANGTASWTPATAASLRLAGSNILSVDLTGLQLLDEGKAPVSSKTESGAPAKDLPDVTLTLPTGSIDARQITVRRRFGIYDRFEREEWVSATDIPGALWLDEADIGELVIASPSFSKGPNADVRKDGIVLERAVVRHLKVPRLPCGTGETGFPIPMALGGADIRSFSFRMDDSNGGTVTPGRVDGREAQDYVALLESDRDLRRELYRSVYRQFRDVGNTRAALQMVVAEGYRTFRQPRGKWKIGAALGSRWFSRIGLNRLINLIGEGFARLWNIVFGTLLRYGASPMPMVVVGVSLFLVSLFAVSLDPRNFEVSGAVREVLGRNGVSIVALVGPGLEGRESVADRVFTLDGIARGYDVCDDGVVLGPAPEQWGAWEALWVTARYHVPIIGMSAVSEFEPTNDRSLVFAGLGPLSSCQALETGLSLTEQAGARDPRWFTSETWFTIMSILGWIIWPLVLTFLIRRLLRD